MVNHRPANLRSPGREILIHDDHIDRPADVANGVA